MKLIFAQGNPGDQYNTTRHNVGFAILDALAKKFEASFTSKPKFFADIAELNIEGEKILLVKPATFYNETGKSARALVDFYKLAPATDVLVVHDDLALPFGTLRTREKGSDAGNNGIKSLNAHLGPDYARLRIGI
ncbi:MAG: aminoacyl-tRNA hydrolase, partial [Candidatus Saccharibacteria bacterium]